MDRNQSLTQLSFAVMGRPIAHSRSPFIHQAFAESLKINLHYRAIEVQGSLAESVANFRAEGGIGINVTVPFKEDAFALAEIHYPRAQRAGASNTLWWDDTGKLNADNTDGIGLLRAIRIHASTPIEGKHLLILGAGGAVRGVLAPLLMERPQTIIIANRTLAKARQLVDLFSDMKQDCHLRAIGLDEINHSQALVDNGFDIVINATSIGIIHESSAELFNLNRSQIHTTTLMMDMVYGKETPMSRWAKRHLCNYQDGLAMLVEQASSSFERWHGVRPEVATVLAKLRQDIESK